MESKRRWEGRRYSDEERQQMYRMLLEGADYIAIAEALDCSLNAIYRVFGAQRDRAPADRRAALRLALAEREEISRGLHAGDSFRTIATALRRAVSTISREVLANGGRSAYRVWRSDDRAVRLTRRPRTPKLARVIELRQQVESLLSDRWSPQQISAHLARTYPDDTTMRVSHETIYQALFVQGRGALRKELTACLRSGRTTRRPRDRVKPAGLLAGMVMISDRPAEAEDRAVPGHWEGDLLVGPSNRSAIGTLVERKTRYVMLLHLPHGRTAEHVRDALTKRIRELPATLRASLTWDQGKEMAEHLRFTVDTGVQVYFCDPRSPWQRGSNENTNGLLRQYFPKGTDLSAHDERHLERVADQLNRRPRKTLEWHSPTEAYAAAVATTD